MVEACLFAPPSQGQSAANCEKQFVLRPRVADELKGPLVNERNGDSADA